MSTKMGLQAIPESLVSAVTTPGSVIFTDQGNNYLVISGGTKVKMSDVVFTNTLTDLNEVDISKRFENKIFVVREGLRAYTYINGEPKELCKEPIFTNLVDGLVPKVNVPSASTRSKLFLRADGVWAYVPDPPLLQRTIVFSFPVYGGMKEQIFTHVPYEGALKELRITIADQVNYSIQGELKIGESYVRYITLPPGESMATMVLTGNIDNQIATFSLLPQDFEGKAQLKGINVLVNFLEDISPDYP